MCTLSNRLQLCSCSEIDFEKAENYWAFYRWQRPQKEMDMIIGETLLPLSLDPATEVLNEQTLLCLLNGENPFDTDLFPKQHDRLSLHFACRQEVLVYGFRYYRHKWVPAEYDPFSWQWRHQEIAGGEIWEPFEKE